MVDALPDRPIKGRGAISNRAGRFEPHQRVAADDGWPGDDGGDEVSNPETTVSVDHARSIITRNNSPDVPFDTSINPYRGCEHGCVYCYARPSHAYLGLSPGRDFETKLFYKPDAARLLQRELSRRGYRPRTIALGANTDPYQPVERRLRQTRAILEVLAEARHPVGIITKSSLIVRDLDLLAPMAASRLARVCVSVTTLDGDLARRLEPRAAAPARRLAAIRALADAGVPVSVMVAPIIPALTDHELDAILEASAAAGASHANYILLRLPGEIAGLFEEWLRAHAPGRAERVLNRVRETRGGALYQAAFGRRMTGQGEHARLLAARFARACSRYGLARRDWHLDCSQFRPPQASGDQLRLL